MHYPISLKDSFYCAKSNFHLHISLVHFMSVTELSKFWATGLKNDRYLSATFYLSYRDFVSLVSRCYVRGQGHICCPRDD